MTAFGIILAIAVVIMIAILTWYLAHERRTRARASYGRDYEHAVRVLDHHRRAS